MSVSSFHQFDEKQIPSDHDRIPPPSHRHAAPSAPWPWVDIEDGACSTERRSTITLIILLTEVDPVQLECPLPPIPPPCDHKTCGGCWTGYPQSLFPNWTPRQVEKCKMRSAIDDYRRDIPCKIYHVDVGEDGFFKDAGVEVAGESNKSEIWQRIIHSTVRLFFFRYSLYPGRTRPDYSTSVPRSRRPPDSSSFYRKYVWTYTPNARNTVRIYSWFHRAILDAQRVKMYDLLARYSPYRCI